LYITINAKADLKQARKLRKGANKKKRELKRQQYKIPTLTLVKSTATPANLHRQIQSDKSYTVVCDGVLADGDQSKVGIGLLIFRNDALTEFALGSEFIQSQTANRAKLLSLEKALQAVENLLCDDQAKTVQIISDSNYALDSLRCAPLNSARGWTRGNGKPVKNMDLIMSMLDLYVEYQGQISLTLIPESAACTVTDAVKNLARAAITTMVGGMRYDNDLITLETIAEYAPEDLFDD
jgi:ribonuclease HI